ncbi:MAG: hypothetical protein HHAS10_03870 [Candidatus Altimarinota bacterium]
MFQNFDFDYWHIKILYDLSGYIVAFLVTWIFSKYILRKHEVPDVFSSEEEKSEYMIFTIAGAMFFGVLISTFDGAMIPGRNPTEGILLSKSIAGALFGGVITAELYKYYHKITQPTGILFLPGIVLGLGVGRIGAIVTGIRDFTYGLPTNLPWGMDFGDGVLRHPTMIYEMILLMVFFTVFLLGLYSFSRKWWIQRGFYVFILVYFLYRFLVGFIQPYSHFWFGLSTYQVIAIPMILYGLYMLRKKF